MVQGCDKGGDVGRGPGRRCRGLWRGCGAKRCVRGHKATGGCGHDGGWELVVEGKPGSRFQKNYFFRVRVGTLGDDAGVLAQSVRQWWDRTTEVATKIVSRGWERDQESRTRVASVVANASRESGSRM